MGKTAAQRIATLEREAEVSATANARMLATITALERKLAEVRSKTHRLLMEDWEPLPQRVKDYIHDFETNADPGGIVQDNVALRQNCEGLILALAAAQADNKRVDWMVEAGLADRNYIDEAIEKRKNVT